MVTAMAARQVTCGSCGARTHIPDQDWPIQRDAVDEWWEMTGARDQNGQEIPLRRGLLNLVMTKHDALWAIAVMHNMDLPVSP